MSGELKGKSVIGPITWRVLAAVLTVFGLFLLFSQVWLLGPVRIVIHTLLAFLAFIGAGIISFDIRKKSETQQYIILAFFLFTVIVNFVAAIWHISPAYATLEIVEVMADLVEMMLIGFLLLVAFLPQNRIQSATSIKHGVLILFGLTIGALLVYGLTYYFLLPILVLINPSVSGLGLGVCCLVVYIVIFLVLFKNISVLSRFSLVPLITGLILMVASTMSLLVSFFLPVSLLSASIMIRAAMMYSFFIAIALPVQIESGIEVRKAHQYASSLALLAVIPYILTLMAVAYIPLSWVFPEQGIYTLTHLLLAFLSAIIVWLLWVFTKQQVMWYRYPLILAFITVTIVESTILFLSPWVELTGEYTLLYAVAGLIIVFWLYLSIRWIYKQPKSKQPEHMPRFIGIVSLFMFFIVLGGVWLQNILYLFLPWMTVQLISRFLLLAVCLVAMFFFTYLFAIFLHVRKGQFTMGIVVLGTLSLWNITNIIRVNFTDWTAGWWIAQFFLLFGFVIGPATLGRLYLSALERSEYERKRATLYADILVHEIRNYLTDIQFSLDLLTLAQDPTEVSDTVTDSIQLALDRSSRLITNVRSLEMASSLKTKDLTPIDVVEVINEAWEHIQDPDEETVEFVVNQQIGESFVRANKLLLEVFINLFRNAVQYSKEEKRIQIDITPYDHQDIRYWEIRVADWGTGISPEEKEKLFTRYSEGAKGLGLGLSVVKSLTEAFGGSIAIENRIPEDYTKGSVFILRFLQA
ncbi:MAG: sensor histidine kinase [Promethearchaeota archaeon]